MSDVLAAVHLSAQDTARLGRVRAAVEDALLHLGQFECDVAEQRARLVARVNAAQQRLVTFDQLVREDYDLSPEARWELQVEANAYVPVGVPSQSIPDVPKET